MNQVGKETCVCLLICFHQVKCKKNSQIQTASYQFSQGKVRPNETVKLNAFVAAKSTKLGPNLELVLDGLAIGSLLECVLLQVNITKVCLGFNVPSIAFSVHLLMRLNDEMVSPNLQIIGSVWEGIVQFQPQVCERLTYTLLKQLDCGGPDLFSVTLNCIRHIVQPDCAARVSWNSSVTRFDGVVVSHSVSVADFECDLERLGASRWPLGGPVRETDVFGQCSAGSRRRHLGPNRGLAGFVSERSGPSFRPNQPVQSPVFATGQPHRPTGALSPVR